MALYEVPDELSLVIVEQQFPDKFLMSSPGKFTYGIRAGQYRPLPLFFVCVRQLRHRNAKYIRADVYAEEHGWWMVDGASDVTAFLPGDRADQQCAVCDKPFPEVEKNGCGYDPKKHR